VNVTTPVAVDKLCVGMYVVQLDRPWLDTPFLFQGFYIRDDDEIDEIRRYCEYVYVSVESLQQIDPKTIDSVTGVNGQQAAAESEARSVDLKALFRKNGSKLEEKSFDQTNRYYRASSSLGEEIKTASGVHSSAVSTLQKVTDQLRSSGQLDVEALDSAVTPMVDSVMRNPAALACLMRMQKTNDYLYQHSIASSVWAVILGRQLGLARADMDTLALGAMLVDVGKTPIPLEILTKPGELDAAERRLMRSHVQFGLDILEKSGNVDRRVIEMVAHHHERFNGTGYPAGIKGNAIPVYGRIAGIVDAYDAMITPRPYAALVSSHDAIRQLQKLADVEFQSELVDQFTRAIGAFPTGTLVELNTGEVAIVTQLNRIRRLRPRVMVIIDADGEIMDDSRIIDLDTEKVSSQGEHSLWIERGLPPGSHGIDPTEYYLS